MSYPYNNQQPPPNHGQYAPQGQGQQPQYGQNQFQQNQYAQPNAYGSPQQMPPAQQPFAPNPAYNMPQPGFQQPPGPQQGQYNNMPPPPQQQQPQAFPPQPNVAPYQNNNQGFPPMPAPQQHQGMPGQGNEFGFQQQGMPAMPPPQPAQPPQQAQAQPTPSAQQQMASRPVIPPGVEPVDPRFLSTTVNAVPKTSQLRNNSRLPGGLVLQPMADVQRELPVVNFGAAGVIRCSDCRAYINPYVYFIDGGARWRCNFCNRHNDVPSNYFAPLDTEGRRQDLNDRPELNQSSIEIVAPEVYMMRPPMPPVFFFLIDVSLKSQQSGMLEVLCRTVKDTLDSLPKRTKVGFLTFDSALHYYALKSTASSPKMYVQADLSDIFAPVPSDLLVSVDECNELIHNLLDSLPAMHAKNQNAESALGPAIDAAVQILASHVGGKLLLFLSGLPSIGVGRLQNRENPRLLGTPTEHTLLQPATDYYTRKAVKLSRYQITVDTYLFADGYMDVATIGQLSRYTAGQTYYYPSFRGDMDGEKMAHDIRHNLTRITGWEAVLRIRCSVGLKIKNYFGNFFLRSEDLLATPCIDQDKAITCEFTSKDTIQAPTISIQAGLLYTTSSGERRIRVHTTNLPVCQNLQDIYNAANANAMVNLVAKKSVDTMLANGFGPARELIRGNCINACRGFLSSTRVGALPVSLAAYPLLGLGLLKSVAFMGGADVRSDQRAQVLSDLRAMGTNELETFIRPRMLPLHTMRSQDGAHYGLADEKGSVALPPEAGLSSAELAKEEGTVFMIDNGFTFFIRVSRDTQPTILKELFGVDSFDQASQLTLMPPTGDEALFLDRVHCIMNYLRGLTQSYQDVYILKEGDAMEIAFFNQLMEDRTNHGEESLQDLMGKIYHAS